MKVPLRPLVVETLYPTKAYNLPAVCDRYGLDPGSEDEAFNSKRQYVRVRLEKLTDDRVLDVAKRVVRDHPNDELLAAIEQHVHDFRLISAISRRHLVEALNGIDLGGKLDLVDMLRRHWPSIDMEQTSPFGFETLADDIAKYSERKNGWSNTEILGKVGFFTCSQEKLFEFLSDVVDPIRRDAEGQERIAAILNPILGRDGYALQADEQVSGYPVYKVKATSVTGTQPADALISKTLITFDESGVHYAWQKALGRRRSDPEGAITAAKTLLETVCKHIIDEEGAAYGENDDLPKLYHKAAESLNLAPSLHSEKVFKAILGNCQSIVGNLAGLRNKLGDSHGQGKRHVRPLERHAELAVNLAGTMAMFLVSTWESRRN